LRVTRTVLLALALLIAPPAFAQETPQDAIETLATAIQKGDPRQTLDLFDPGIPGFADLKRNIEALSALPDTNCAISITHTTQSKDSIRFETDWSLQTSNKENGPLLDHRDSVTISLHRAGNIWKIISFSPLTVLAPPDPAVFKLIAALAADLNDKNQSGALGAFDPRMKQYGEIDNNIDALVTQNDVLCAIDVVGDRQTAGVHTLDLDWYLQLKARADAGPVRQRRERVRVNLQQIRGKWKIDHIEPLDILSPFNDR
jgi:hypothetical protein